MELKPSILASKYMIVLALDEVTVLYWSGRELQRYRLWMANVVEEAFASKKGDLLSVFEGDDFHKLPVAKQGDIPARTI